MGYLLPAVIVCEVNGYEEVLKFVSEMRLRNLGLGCDCFALLFSLLIRLLFTGHMILKGYCPYNCNYQIYNGTIAPFEMTLNEILTI